MHRRSRLLAKMNGLDPADIERLQNRRVLESAKLEGLRQFVDVVVERRGQVSEGDLARFFAAGFTKAQVFEVIFGVALKTLTNYANHIAKPAVNERFSAFRPRWADAA